MTYIMTEEPWTVRDEYFPRTGDPSEQLKFLLNYAVLAPSIYNTQPWLFKVTGSEVALYLDRARALPVVDPLGRNLVISCGAALFHLRISIRHFGYDPVVRTFPDLDISDLLAFIRLGGRKEASREEDRLFAAIRKRRTIRSAFSERPVPAALLRRLQDAVASEGANVHIVQDVEDQKALADLIREANEIRSRDARFKNEYHRWTRVRGGYQAPGRIERPALIAGISDAPPSATLRGQRREQLQNLEEKLALPGPVFVVLSTKGDNMPSWLEAGQALSRLLLTAADSGLKAAFLSHPVGIEQMREDVGVLTKETTYPQVVLRIGYGVPGMPTRRHPVADVTSEP